MRFKLSLRGFLLMLVFLVLAQLGTVFGVPFGNRIARVKTTISAAPAQIARSINTLIPKKAVPLIFNRQVSKEDWDTAYGKGCNYNRLMRGTIAWTDSQQRPQSSWTWNDLDAWGWATTTTSLDDANFQALQLEPASNRPRLQVSSCYHEEETTHDNIGYPASGGGYENVFNPDDGVIYALYSIDPQAYIESEDLDYPAPLLHRWSDVTYLQWEHVAGGSIQNLHRIVQVHVSNDKTEALINQALTNQGTSLDGHVGFNNRMRFPVGSQEGLALLNTPNAVGAAWFLIQHKNQLGLKRISEVAVFTADDQVYMVLELESVPADQIINVGEDGLKKRNTDIPQNNTDVTDNNNNGASVFRPKEYKHTTDGIKANHSKRALDWQTAVGKGCQFRRLMKMTIEEANRNNCPQSGYLLPAVLDVWGWTEEDEELNEGQFEELIYEELEQDTPSYLKKVENWHTQDRTVLGVYYPATMAYYINIYNIRDGVIYAQNNNGPDSQRAERPSAFAAGSRPPQLKQWSDIAFIEWTKLAQGNTDNFNRVVQVTIINDATKAIIREAFARYDRVLDPDASVDQPVQFWPGEEAFDALLGTPNAVGVAWFLIQHKQQLGIREITNIKVFLDNISEEEFEEMDEFLIQPYMVFEIDLVPGNQIIGGGAMATDSEVQPSAQDEVKPDLNRQDSAVDLTDIFNQSSRIELRDVSHAHVRRDSAVELPEEHVKRQVSSADWDNAVQRGCQWKALMRHTIPAAQGLGFPQSEFVNYDDLDRWGWEAEILHYEQWELDQQLDEYIVDAAELRCVANNHENDRMINGVFYQATTGSYSNYYSTEAGIIFAMANFGPESQLLENLSSFAPNSQLPRLKRWSDVVFLEWQRGAGNKVADLHYIVQANIVNPKTRSLFFEVLKRMNRKLDEEMTLDQVPVILTPDQDEFSAMLTSPNVIGAVNLLMQHKRQLGIAEISTITIFLDETAAKSLDLIVGDAIPFWIELTIRDVAQGDIINAPIFRLPGQASTQDEPESVLDRIDSAVDLSKAFNESVRID